MVNGEESPSASPGHQLKELDIQLPKLAEPFSTYIEAVQSGNLLF